LLVMLSHGGDILGCGCGVVRRVVVVELGGGLKELAAEVLQQP
jgi:hypothetical protein